METPCRDKLGRAQSSQGTRCKDCAKIPRVKGLKLLADCQEAAAVAPPGLKPGEAEVALARAAPEAGDEPAVEAPPDGAESHDRELPLQFRVLSSEG